MRPESGFAEVNGTRLFYETAGSGPPLVLIHGFSLDTRAWDSQWEPLARKHRVVRYDLRGFGRSDPPGGGYRHHEDLAALLERLGIASATLLGHSTGGSVALDFAVARPEAVSSLVLFGSIAGGFPFSPDFAGALQQVYALAGTHGLDAAREAWLRLLAFRPREDPALEDHLRRIVADYSGWHWLNPDPVLSLEPPAMQRLGAVRGPTLTVIGERDVPDCHRICELVNRAVPGAEHVVLPGLGHMANLEAPTLFNDAVLGFLDRTVPPR